MKNRLLAFLAALSLFVLPVGSLAAEKLTPDDLVFMFDLAAYAPGGEAQPLVDAIEARLGSMNRVEMESCLFSGLDLEYSNNEIVLGTYPIGKGGADQIETIMVVGGEYQTPRGIGIGSSKEDVIAAYGTDFTLDYDQMIYAVGNPITEPVLVFQLDLETDQVAAYYMMRNSS